MLNRFENTNFEYIVLLQYIVTFFSLAWKKNSFHLFINAWQLLFAATKSLSFKGAPYMQSRGLFVSQEWSDKFKKYFGFGLQYADQ